MKKLVLIEVNEKVIETTNTTIEREFGWLEESGIRFKELYDELIGTELLKLAIEKMVNEYIEDRKFSLSQQELENAVNGVEYWINMTLPESIAESVSSCRE